MARWKRGLAEGEKGDPARPLLVLEPPLPESGELEYEVPWLFGVAFNELDERRYRGGVMYWVSGVAGGVEVGLRPNSARCEGVNGISERSSGLVYNGRNARIMFMRKQSRMTHSKYCGSGDTAKLVPRRLRLQTGQSLLPVGKKPYFAVMVEPKNHVMAIAAAFHLSFLRFCSPKLESFCLCRISSSRGCLQFPGDGDTIGGAWDFALGVEGRLSVAIMGSLNRISRDTIVYESN